MKRTSRGFTLIELMTVIVIIVILYSMMPDLTTPLRGTQLQRARSDIEMLAIGLWGPSRDYQGFVGDIGIVHGEDGTSLQQAGLDSLLVFPQSSGTFFAATNTSGITAGWNGPYAGFDPRGLVEDPWGQPWEVLANGQVHSRGPDRTPNTDDDLYAPVGGPLEKGLTGTVAVTVVDMEGRQLTSEQVSVEIWRPDTSAGAIPRGSNIHVSVPVLTGTDDTFVVYDLPPGRHLIEVNGVNDPTKSCDGDFSVGGCVGLYGQGVANIIGGSLATVQVQVHP